MEQTMLNPMVLVNEHGGFSQPRMGYKGDIMGQQWITPPEKVNPPILTAD